MTCYPAWSTGWPRFKQLKTTGLGGSVIHNRRDPRLSRGKMWLHNPEEMLFP